MLDIKFVRENPEVVKQNIRNKFQDNKLELVDNKSNYVMNGIAFGQSSHVRYIKTKRSFDICYTIEENTHKRGEVQLQIEDIKPIE